jgi:rhodanese-related sulfurtransferase
MAASMEWVLLVDEGGARAAEMAVWLRARGVNARYLVGGMSTWRGAVERS